jgi:hypothetical protein
LCWSVLGPHRIGKHRSWAGTNGHGRYVEAAGWRIFIAPTWDAGALQRWVRIPPPPPSSCAVCAGQSGCRPVSEGRWLAGCSPFAHKERQEPNTRRAPPLVHGGLVACRGVHRPPGPRAGQTARPGIQEGCTMTEASFSFAGNLTDDPQARYTEVPSGPPCRTGRRHADAGCSSRGLPLLTVLPTARPVPVRRQRQGGEPRPC